MSRDARECDRCGKLYKKYIIVNDDLAGVGMGGINGIVAANICNKDVWYSDKAVDLCPECMGEFIKFWKMEEKQGWIPVSERLPENGEVVAAYSAANGMAENGWRSKYTGVWRLNNGQEIEDVTHWMPLPEPYKEDAE